MAVTRRDERYVASRNPAARQGEICLYWAHSIQESKLYCPLLQAPLEICPRNILFHVCCIQALVICIYVCHTNKVHLNFEIELRER